MKTYSDWKNEQLIKKLAENMMSATPIPDVPVTPNGDPMNSIGPQPSTTPGEFFGNTRFAPHLRSKMIQKKKNVGQAGKVL